MTFLSSLISHNGLTFKLFLQETRSVKDLCCNNAAFCCPQMTKRAVIISFIIAQTYFLLPFLWKCGIKMIYPVLFGIPNAHELGAVSACP